jgi:uncharacterized protein (TIGR02217 family)
VRLWNYAEGGVDDAWITLDFDALDGGFLLPGEADPVWPGDIDRIFLSLVPPDYTGGDGSLGQPREAWVELSNMVSTGSGSVLPIGDTFLPEHRLRVATGFDDAYNQTPERLLRTILHLGYRRLINHYVGMSHYYRLEHYAWASTPLVSLTGGALNLPCAAWHGDFLARAGALGFTVILSLSYELLDTICFDDWKQRDELGNPALTGWEPPSALLSPANGGAMNYLKAVAQAFVALASTAGQPVHFQIGEPWWWITPDEPRRICLYDAAARAAFGPLLTSIPTIAGAMSAEQEAMLDRAGALLAQSTAGLADAVRSVSPTATLYILVYLPTVLDGDAPQAVRANVPLGWAFPAFDVLQIEDYDWVSRANAGAGRRGIAAMTARLGYPASLQHYFAGFVLTPEDRSQWPLIEAATRAAEQRSTAEVFVWALPQISRDGFTHFDEENGTMLAFDDVLFPLALGRDALVSPVFSTAVVTTASGAEHRNSDWSDARMHYDAGPGVRATDDLETLLAFFRARHGAARGFRFRDPFDHSSHGMTGSPAATDQLLGSGDGIRTRFALRKTYGEGDDAQQRLIAHPVPGSVRVAIDALDQAAGWGMAGGQIDFDEPPADGAEITAGFLFDVPVRFAEDRLAVSRTTFGAGEAVEVPLIEVRGDG